MKCSFEGERHSVDEGGIHDLTEVPTQCPPCRETLNASFLINCTFKSLSYVWVTEKTLELAK